MRLYAYDGERSVLRGDAHAVQIELSAEDVARIGEVREHEAARLDRWSIGEYVEVTDQESGRIYRVASAPCGQPCHCAAVAELVG